MTRLVLVIFTTMLCCAVAGCRNVTPSSSGGQTVDETGQFSEYLIDSSGHPVEFLKGMDDQYAHVEYMDDNTPVNLIGDNNVALPGKNNQIELMVRFRPTCSVDPQHKQQLVEEAAGIWKNLEKKDDISGYSIVEIVACPAPKGDPSAKATYFSIHWNRVGGAWRVNDGSFEIDGLIMFKNSEEKKPGPGSRQFSEYVIDRHGNPIQLIRGLDDQYSASVFLDNGMLINFIGDGNVTMLGGSGKEEAMFRYRPSMSVDLENRKQLVREAVEIWSQEEKGVDADGVSVAEIVACPSPEGNPSLNKVFYSTRWTKSGGRWVNMGGKFETMSLKMFKNADNKQLP